MDKRADIWAFGVVLHHTCDISLYANTTGNRVQKVEPDGSIGAMPEEPDAV